MSLLAAPVLANAQMSTRGVKASSRPKASGLPFNAWFTDVAAKAGLTAPVIYGGVDANAYILEAIENCTALLSSITIMTAGSTSFFFPGPGGRARQRTRPTGSTTTIATAHFPM